MLDRRGFIKFVGGAVVGTLASPVIWKTLDDISIWTQNWPWIPKLEKGNGLNSWVRTTSKLCPSATGMRIRLVGGRPVRALGDSEHPLSRGGISALAGAEVQLRHSPARLRQPLKRKSDGSHVAIPWHEAEALLASALGTAREKGGMFCLSGDENGSMNELLSALTRKTGSTDFYLMPSEAHYASAAWRLVGGKGRIGYDFAQSDCVLAVGAEVLESWGPVVGNRRAWGNARAFGEKASMRLAYAGPVQNNTASGADLWLPLRPGTEPVLLLGMIRAFSQASLFSTSVPDDLAALAALWTPARVAEHAGIPETRLAALTKMVLEAKAPLVIVGAEPGKHCSTASMLLGIALNALLGRINTDGGLRALPVAEPVFPSAMKYDEMMAQDFTAAAQQVAAGKKTAPSLVLVYEANPVYAMPFEAGVGTLLEKAGFSVSFSCFFDETARRCDLVLPTAMGLERFDDVVTPYGVGEALYALCRPVAEPLYEARVAGDVLLNGAERAGLALGFKSYVNALEAKARAQGVEWSRLLKEGCVTTRSTVPSQTLHFPGEIVAAAVKAIPRKPAGQNLAVAVVDKRAFGTPDTGIPPFCTKLVTDAELVGYDLAARMNRKTAERLALEEGQHVFLVSGKTRIPARVQLFEGVVMDTVALAAGFGHENFDAFSDGKGSNVYSLFGTALEPGTSLAVWNCSDVKIVKA